MIVSNSFYLGSNLLLTVYTSLGLLFGGLVEVSQASQVSGNQSLNAPVFSATAGKKPGTYRVQLKNGKKVLWTSPSDRAKCSKNCTTRNWLVEDLNLAVDVGLIVARYSSSQDLESPDLQIGNPEIGLVSLENEKLELLENLLEDDAIQGHLSVLVIDEMRSAESALLNQLKICTDKLGWPVYHHQEKFFQPFLKIKLLKKYEKEISKLERKLKHCEKKLGVDQAIWEASGN